MLHRQPRALRAECYHLVDSFYFVDRPRGRGRTQKIGTANSGHFTPKMWTALAYEYAKVRAEVYYGGPKEHTFAKEVAMAYVVVSTTH